MSSISAGTTNNTGLVQTADTTGVLNIQSSASTIGVFSSAGLAVTGTLSATTSLAVGSGNSALKIDALGANNFEIYNGALTADGTNYAFAQNFTGANTQVNAASGGQVLLQIAGVTKATLTSTGLNSTAIGATTPSTGAFTTVSATGTISGGTSGTGYSFNGSAPATSLVLDSAGSLGVGGTPVNARKLLVSTASQTDISINAGSSAYGQLLFGYTGADNKGIVAYNNSDNSMQFYTNVTERMRLNSTGALVLAGGTTAANGIGIAFPATQSASTDANTLDDYEEGTWTPTLTFGNVAHNGTYSYQSGVYTKVGRLVTVTGTIGINSAGTATGTARITSLPFTAMNQSGNAVVLGVFNGFTGLTGTALFGDGPTNNALITLYQSNAGTAAGVDKTNFTTGGSNYIEFTFSYFST